MNQIRGLAAFAILALSLILNPAWGGGWESSGSPRSAPNTSSPIDYLPLTCTFTAAPSPAPNDTEENFHWTEVLTRDHFKNGVATVKTSSDKYDFLDGHKLTLVGWGSAEGGFTRLTLTAVSKDKYGEFKASTLAQGTLKSVSANVTVKNSRSGRSLSLKVHCFDPVR